MSQVICQLVGSIARPRAYVSTGADRPADLSGHVGLVGDLWLSQKGNSCARHRFAIILPLPTCLHPSAITKGISMSTPNDVVSVTPAQPVQKTRLRIWPVLPFLAYMIGAQIAVRTLTSWDRNVMMLVIFGPVLCMLAVGLWWLFASRAAWRDRILGLVGGGVLAGIAFALIDPTMRGFGFTFTVLPVVATAATVAIVVLSRLGSRKATVAALAVSAIAFGYWDLVRYDGMSGDFKPDIHWRWEKTAEDKFLATLPTNPPQKPASVEPLGEVTWPQFRGPHNGVVPGVVLDVAWSARPPKQIWRHKVGPGWSSFSVAGNRLFTQEQRGPKEVVVCYDAKTGAERWVHESPARFAETMGGVGPRATPTIAGGRTVHAWRNRAARLPRSAHRRVEMGARSEKRRAAHAADVGLCLVTTGCRRQSRGVRRRQGRERGFGLRDEDGQAVLVGPRRATTPTVRRNWRRSRDRT